MLSTPLVTSPTIKYYCYDPIATHTQDHGVYHKVTQNSNPIPDSITLTLAKPQYGYKNFGYFKVDFKAPKHLP